MSISYGKRYKTIWVIPCSPNRVVFCENSHGVDNNFRLKIALLNVVSFSASFHIPLATLFKQLSCMEKYRDPEIPKAWIPGFGIYTIPGSRDPDPGIISPNRHWWRASPHAALVKLCRWISKAFSGCLFVMVPNRGCQTVRSSHLLVASGKSCFLIYLPAGI